MGADVSVGRLDWFNYVPSFVSKHITAESFQRLEQVDMEARLLSVRRSNAVDHAAY